MRRRCIDNRNRHWGISIPPQYLISFSFGKAIWAAILSHFFSLSAQPQGQKGCTVPQGQKGCRVSLHVISAYLEERLFSSIYFVLKIYCNFFNKIFRPDNKYDWCSFKNLIYEYLRAFFLMICDILASKATLCNKSYSIPNSTYLFIVWEPFEIWYFTKLYILFWDEHKFIQTNIKNLKNRSTI